MNGMNTIFVYGSLKMGERLHDALEGSIFVGPGKIPGVLFDLGAFPATVGLDVAPENIRSKTIGEVHGEIFTVSAKTIRRLDQIEGHPVFYRREPIDELTTGMRVWTYLMPWDVLNHGRARLLPKGVWSGKNPGVMEYA